MLCRVRGYNSGFGDYLRIGHKAGNKLHRDDLDKRVMLYGDLAVTESIVESMPDKGSDRYLHITLSFKEDYISHHQLNESLSSFMAKIMCAYDKEEYAYYAEAHLPKIKNILNESTGEQEERKPHIHIILPKINLVSGEYLNPLGYYPHNEKYVEAIQEVINHEMNFDSPRDNRRRMLHDVSDIISRHKGDLFKSDSRNLKERVLTDILMKEITTYENFQTLLESYGELKVRNKNSSAPYFNLKENGAAKGVNLKEWIFTPEFISLSHEEKVKQIAKNGSMRDAGRKNTDYQQDLQILKDWTTFRSAEIKLLHPGSKEYREYKQLNHAERLDYLTRRKCNDEQKIREHCRDTESPFQTSVVSLISKELREHYHVKRNISHQKSGIYQNERKWSSGRNDREQPRLFEYNMRGLQRRAMVPNFFKETERLLWKDSQYYVGDETKGISHAVRFPIDRKNARRNGGRRLNGFYEGFIEAETATYQPLIRTSDNCVESLRTDIASNILQLSSDKKEKWNQIKKHLNVQMLLLALQNTHGIRIDGYQIVKGKDGLDRIKAGNRAFTASDFLTKELNFNWKEASSYLENEYSRQLNDDQLKATVRPAINFWAEFKQWQQEPGNRYKDSWDEWKDSIRNERKILNRQFRSRQTEIFQNKQLSYSDRSAALSVLRLEKIKARELQEAHFKNERMKMKQSLQTQQRYLQFLQLCVDRGDEGALSELRRYSRRVDKRNNSGDFFETPYEHDIVLNNVSYKVSHSGKVSYLIDDKIAVEDTREWLAVVQKDNDVAIELAIKLAQEKNHYRPLELTGSDDFKNAVIRVALEKRISVKFKDETLQRLYEESLAKKLEEAKENANRTAPR